jgi:hypothetical protein
MRLKSTSFVAMALLATLAHAETTPPPHGEPFSKWLGGVTALHCEHGGNGTWYLSGTRPTGWGFYITSSGTPWAFYYPSVAWVRNGSFGPSTHLTVNIWAVNSSYLGTAYPPYDPHDIGVFVEVPFNHLWITQEPEECFGIGGANE